MDRPISDITSKIRYDYLEQDLKEVLKKLTMREAEVQDIEGNWYGMRIVPYRTIENVVDGVVITFVDITKVKQGNIALHRLATVVRDSNDAITVQDFEGNITEWNKGAKKMYGYSEDEALKMNIRDIVPEHKREGTMAFVKKLQEQEIESFKTQRLTKDGKTLDVWLTVTKLVGEDGKPVALATTERDITGRKLEGEIAKRK